MWRSYYMGSDCLLERVYQFPLLPAAPGNGWPAPFFPVLSNSMACHVYQLDSWTASPEIGAVTLTSWMALLTYRAQHAWFFKNIFICFYLFFRERERERERESMSGGGAGREGDTESEAGSRLWGVSTEPDKGLEPRTMRSWAEPKLAAQPTEPPRHPSFSVFLNKILKI